MHAHAAYNQANMIDSADYLNVRTWLEACERPLVVSHRRPDGDALGAIAAMTLALEAMGKEPRPTLYEAPPARYAMFAGGVAWQRWDQDRATLASECDSVVIVDTCSWQQLEPLKDWLPGAPRTLVIDHHPRSDDVGVRDGDLRLVDATAAAACLLVGEWMRAAEVTITPTIANTLFTGLATDCGWFRFSNADARALRLAAELVEAGAMPSVLHRAIFEQDPPARLRLIGRMLSKLELHADGRLLVLALRDDDFTAAGADHGMTEDMVNEAERIAGVEGTIMFTEMPDGAVRVNLRSKATLDVSALARQFDGGGHVRAAGARPSGSWDEVVPRVIAAAVEALGKQP